jgi:putative FmdB family regulatory protein
MPLYEYKCAFCGQTAEIRHGFTENQERPCPACGAAMARVFSAAPILFKGSGFYVTDSRKGAAASKGTSETKDDGAKSTDAKSTEAKTTDGGSAPVKSPPAQDSTPKNGPKGTESAA